MHYRIFSILVTFVCLFGCALTTAAQDVNNTDETEKPVILYSGTPKKYEIADIKVEGAQNYEDYVIVGLSGLSKGQTITVPGDEITQACKRYWRHGLFSDVEITADKIEGDQIWLTIHLTMRPRVSIRPESVRQRRLQGPAPAEWREGGQRVRAHQRQPGGRADRGYLRELGRVL